MLRGYLRQIANSVESFMQLAGQELPKVPQIPNIKDLHDRERFLQEEMNEVSDAITRIEEYDGDPRQNVELLQEYTDGLLDVIYVAVGSLLNAGINPEIQEALMQSVCKANNAKFPRLGKQEGRFTVDQLEKMYPKYKVIVREDRVGNGYAALVDPETGKVKKPIEWIDPRTEMSNIIERAIAYGEQRYLAGDLWGK